MLSRAFRSRAIDERRPREKVLRYADAVSGANPMHVVKPFYLQARAAAAAPFPPLATRPRCERRPAGMARSVAHDVAAAHGRAVQPARATAAVRSGAAPAARPPASHARCHRDWAPLGHICSGTGLAPWPHRHWDSAQRCHICSGTGLAPATSAPGLGSPLSHLRRDCAPLGRTCEGSGLAPGHICTGLGSAHACNP